MIKLIVVYSKNVKIRIPEEHYTRLKQEALDRRKTFSYVFREKLGMQNPPFKLNNKRLICRL